MILVFDENADYLGSDFKGETVVLVSNVGGVKDRKFARNFATAKHLADRGSVKRIVVRVVATRERARTVDAFRRAVGEGHSAARSCVTHVDRVEDALTVVDQVGAIMAPIGCDGRGCGACLARGGPVYPRKPRPQDGRDVTDGESVTVKVRDLDEDVSDRSNEKKDN